MATIDLVKIKLNGDTGGGGKPATLESLSVSENGVYVPSEGVDGYNQVNVNVTTPTEVFVVPDGIKFGYSSFTEIPSNIDFSNLNSMSNMFNTCSSLTTIPLLNTSKVTTMYQMFAYCSSLTTIPLLDTSKVTKMNNMFKNCSSLITIPELNTSNVTDMDNMFVDCKSLQTIPVLDCSSVTAMNNIFSGCKVLTNIGGLTNFGKSYKGYSSAFLNLTNNTNLTKESIINIFNSVYDLTLKTDWNGYGIIEIPTTILEELTDAEIAIATNKDWTIR
jgi:surface protein